MYEVDKRLFVGLKISSKLQAGLDDCAHGTGRYFKGDKPESLQVVTLGEDKLIGRFLRDGFPVSEPRQCQPQCPQHRDADHANLPNRGGFHPNIR